MNKMPIGRLATMIDCSRGAVMNVESVKKWIDMTADMGYNTILLYMEDTYEVNNNPYFGLARGRYTQNELREMDAYAIAKGMELIPCIQTLAHLDALTKWPVYNGMRDVGPILLVGDERVYRLIEDMFDSLSKCLTTKHINIGMDEAFLLGRGKYYDIHGGRERIEIFLEHLQEVSKIAKRYGYTVSMWSDMFFRACEEKSRYLYDEATFRPDDIKKMIPDNVEIVFWEYGSTEAERYDSMFKAHRLISDKIWFAGGLWTWVGFGPWNKVAINALQVAFPSCERYGVKDILLTCFQEDSGECARFAVLPSLFFAAEYVRGNRDIEAIKEKFEKKYNIAFDNFMLLDLTTNGRLVNPSKYVFYNDLFNGLLDTIITDELSEEHARVSEKLEKVVGNEEWGYLFQTMKALCDVVSLKADMGIRIRKAYRQNDMEAMKVIVNDCVRLKELMKSFYEAFRTQWYIENKGRGFDVIDLRIGGMITRVDNCTRILQDYIDHRIARIEELEEEVLDRWCREGAIKGDKYVYSFSEMYTANLY